jgi:hypothetical protein
VRLAFYWTAWRELSTDRETGMGVGRIPFTAIVKYAECYGILPDIDAFDRFRLIIRAMDSEFMAVSSMKPGEISARDANGVKSLLKRASEGKQG